MRDARSLDQKTLEEMRRLAVSRVLAGEKQTEVARSLQVDRTTVVRWMASYRRSGADGLAMRKRTGRPPALSVKQHERLRKIIVGKNPRQLGFGAALWTVPLVRQVIEKTFGVVLHETNVVRLLHRLGLTPQKPTRRAFQRDDEECLRWGTVEFPRIVRRAKRKQATLLFLDESAVHENGPIGTTWGRRGERPIVRVTGARRRINVISAVSPRGRLWFRCFPGTLTAPVFISFLEALIRDVRGFIVLVLDRHPAHVAAATRRWLLAHRDRIEVHTLPAYAPDMNPDEHVWSYLKGLFRHEPLNGDEKLVDAVESAMEDIAADRKIVRSFFNHPQVTYVREALNW
jgi:transposase